MFPQGHNLHLLLEGLWGIVSTLEVLFYDILSILNKWLYQNFYRMHFGERIHEGVGG